MALIEVIYEDKGQEKVLSNVQAVESSVKKLKATLKSPLGIGNSQLVPKNFAAPAVQGVQAVMSQINKLKQLAATPIQTKLFQNLAGPQLMQTLTPQVRAAQLQMAQFNQQLKQSGTAMGNATQKSKDMGMQLGFLGRLLAAMAIRKVVHDFIELTDVYTNFQNKLKVQISNPFRLEMATGDIVKIANESRTSIEAVGESFTRTMQATKKFGYTQNDAMKFTENLTKAIQVSGATSNEAKNAIIQLGQGMNKGALQGQDLRSVMEFLPFVSELLTDKMKKLTAGTTNANLSLKELAAKGLITTQMVMEAMSESTDKINERFARLTPTIEGATTVLKNKYMVAIGDSTQLTEKIAKGILWLSDNFETVGTAVVALTAQVTALFALFKGAAAIKFLVANPWLVLAAAIVSAVTALVTFKDEINTSGDGFHSLADASSVVWKQMSKDLRDLTTSAKVTKAALNDMHPDGKDDGGFDWDMYMASFYDAFRSFNLNVFKAQQRLKNKDYGDTGASAVEADYQQGYRTAYEMEKDRKQAVVRRAVMEDAKLQKEKQIADEKYKIDLEGKYNKQNADPAAKKGKKEGGKTFDELINEATFKASVADEDSLSRRIETRLHTELEKLKPSIKKWATSLNEEIRKAQETYENDQSNRDPNAQGHLTATMDKLRSRFGNGKVEQELQLREQVIKTEQEKDIKALILVIEKETTKAKQEYVDKQEKELDRLLEIKAAKIKTLQLQKEEAAAENTRFRQSTAESLDPTIAINRQIKDMERFRDMMKDQPQWVELTNKRIQELRDSMTGVGKAGVMFGQQMNSIFGPGGSMVQGIGDAIAGAKNLDDALRQVFANVAKQAISALVQLPLNMAIGSLMQGMSGGLPGVGPSVAGSVLNPGMGGSFSKNQGLAFKDPGQVYTDGFASGGYTGNMGTNTPAGIVHGQEYVVNANATSKYRPMLEAINKGGNVTGAASGGPKVTIHNYAGVQVESSDNNGEIQVMITKAIAEQTPGIVAKHIGDSNSPIARSMNRHIEASRRRL